VRCRAGDWAMSSGGRVKSRSSVCMGKGRAGADDLAGRGGRTSTAGSGECCPAATSGIIAPAIRKRSEGYTDNFCPIRRGTKGYRVSIAIAVYRGAPGLLGAGRGHRVVGGLVVAALDLKLVRLVRAAMRGVAAGRVRPIHPAPVIEPRKRIEPEPEIEPRSGSSRRRCSSRGGGSESGIGVIGRGIVPRLRRRSVGKSFSLPVAARAAMEGTTVGATARR
jgi:hypothetical protein